MKKILIVAEYFAPINAIPSIRVTKLAKYLKLHGYFVGVVSRKQRVNEISDPTLLDDLKYVDEHISVSESVFANSISYSYKSKNKSNIKPTSVNKISLLTKIINKINSTIMHTFKIYYKTLYYLTKSYSKRAEIFIKELCMHYDVIISSYGPFSAIHLGYVAKCNNSEIFWIADFRDPLIIDWSFQGNQSHYNLLKNKIIKKADFITGVSDACVEEFKSTFKDNIKVIYNGYDRDDIKDIEIKHNNKYSLSYAGGLYNGKRDLSIIFKAISELIKEEKIDKDYIEVNYLGNDGFIFLQQADNYHILDICKSFGKVNRKESLQIQLNSHILLLASWNSSGDTGVITGKFIEYMMINKPIICTITGNLPNSKLKEMIGAANNGVVWEQANNELDYPIVKKYIHEQYKRFINGLSMEFNPNISYIEQYDYSNITSMFIKIIEKKYNR